MHETIVNKVVEDIIKDYNNKLEDTDYKILKTELIKLEEQIVLKPNNIISIVKNNKYESIVIDIIQNESETEIICKLSKILVIKEIKKTIIFCKSFEKLKQVNEIIEVFLKRHKKRFKKKDKKDSIDISSVELLDNDNYDKLKNLITTKIKEYLPKIKKVKIQKKNYKNLNLFVKK
jgi:hypothetical protein